MLPNTSNSVPLLTSYQPSRGSTADNIKTKKGTKQYDNNTTQTSYIVLRKIELRPREWKACDNRPNDGTANACNSIQFTVSCSGLLRHTEMYYGCSKAHEQPVDWWRN